MDQKKHGAYLALTEHEYDLGGGHRMPTRDFPVGRGLLWIGIGIVGGALLVGTPISAQDDLVEEESETRETPPSPELKAATDELAIATARASIAEQRKKQAEAERDADKAKLPATDTEGLEGKVTVGEGAGYFAEILAYRSLEQTAQVIADELKDKCIAHKKIVITDQFDLSQTASLWTLLDTKLQRLVDALQQLDDNYTDAGDPSPLEVAGVLLPTLLGAAADVASFFKVNRDFVARTFTINDAALLAAVSRELNRASCVVLLPELNIAANGALFRKYQDVVQHRQTLGEKFKKVEGKLKKDVTNYAKKTAEIAEQEVMRRKAERADDADAVAEIDRKIEQLKKERSQWLNGHEAWEKAKAEFQTAFTATDSTLEAITTPPEKGQKSPLQLVAAIDSIKSVGADASLLYVGVVSHGGEVEVTTSIWTGGRVSYIGGTVSVFFVTDQAGGLFGAGLLPEHSRAVYGTRRGVATLKELDPRNIAPTNAERCAQAQAVVKACPTASQ